MKNMIRQLIFKILGVNLVNLKSNITGLNHQQRIGNGLAKGALGASGRIISEKDPLSWEFSAFSQNGEDGIIDFLTRKLLSPNKYFIEIGASNGVECNSAYLAFTRNYSGLMIDGDPDQVANAQKLKHNAGVEYHSAFLNLQNLHQIKDWSLYSNPDVCSWDTDGNDYYFVKQLLTDGFRPKIFVVEFNSTFGPDQKLSVVYNDSFNIQTAHESHLYYGCSVALWKELFAQHNYRFVTVDSNGVNAIFADNTQFEASFLNQLNGLSFAENFYQKRKFRNNWNEQFGLIQHMPFYTG
jgi:hypothetical protein